MGIANLRPVPATWPIKNGDGRTALNTIFARYDAQAEQWVATFGGRPQVAFGGNIPVVAIRRLL
jgi:hypothetical protein